MNIDHFWAQQKVKAVIKSTRDLWRKGSGVPGDPWFRLGIVGVTIEIGHQIGPKAK
jgi:hypothetical protein